MPVSAELIARRIYLSRYSGIVTAEELRHSECQVLALREKYHDFATYILILDVSKLVRVQIDFQLVRNLVQGNKVLFAQVIVGASHSAKITALGFGTAFKLKYRFADSIEEAIPLAHAYLREAGN
jgi:hypothetical protein